MEEREKSGVGAGEIFRWGERMKMSLLSLGLVSAHAARLAGERRGAAHAAELGRRIVAQSVEAELASRSKRPKRAARGLGAHAAIARAPDRGRERKLRRRAVLAAVGRASVEDADAAAGHLDVELVAREICAAVRDLYNQRAPAARSALQLQLIACAAAAVGCRKRIQKPVLLKRLVVDACIRRVAVAAARAGIAAVRVGSRAIAAARAHGSAQHVRHVARPRARALAAVPVPCGGGSSLPGPALDGDAAAVAVVLVVRVVARRDVCGRRRLALVAATRGLQRHVARRPAVWAAAGLVAGCSVVGSAVSARVCPAAAAVCCSAVRVQNGSH
eukprot:comp4357_c0_seq1/m.2895 comp4357_c0_seq1/g.2895  ORF comp4357_c0_seq1/g.2895 comp4357_c0_seq1/m.2895 type:complete len:331 (+) comp4357_c0_seq1:91-1083(+)